jgi:hypothetical protein
VVLFDQLRPNHPASSSTDPMPSVPHEMLVELLAKSPQLLPPLLGDRLDAAVGIPRGDLCIRCGQSTTSQVPVLFADLGLELHRPSATPSMALTVEVQLTLDDDKPYSWIPYLGGQYHRLHVPTYLLVVTNDPVIAAWAAGPFRAGHLTLEPWVLGPADVPAIVTLEEARKSLDMTLFSGIVHGRERIATRIGPVLRQALEEAPDDVGLYYWDAFLASLSEPVRKELDMQLHPFQPRSDWSKEIFAKGLAEGEAKGRTEGEMLGAARARAEDILFLLAARHFAVGARLRRRIIQCTDLALLESWFHKAATAKSLEAIFATEPPEHPSGRAGARRSLPSAARARPLPRA